jgi:hypothetical protein
MFSKHDNKKCIGSKSFPTEVPYIEKVPYLKEQMACSSQSLLNFEAAYQR